MVSEVTRLGIGGRVAYACHMSRTASRIVSIPDTAVKTSAVGFGTSGIMGSALTDRGRLKLLECAFEAGITHFDTAPLYGMGDAEALVGKFISRHRGAVTVATKYGLLPPDLSRWQKLGAPLARTLYHRSPTLKKALDVAVLRRNRSRGAAKQTNARPVEAAAPPVTAYRCTDIEQSVHRSLRNLGVEAIDVLLLHDCLPSNVSDDVLACLQKIVEQGKILSYGLATGKAASAEILTRLVDFRGVVQVPLTVMDGGLRQVQLANNLLTVTHSALNRIVARLQRYLDVGENCRRWSDAIGIDLSCPRSISTFLLAHARQSNDDGIVLFSSRELDNIRANAKALCDLYLTAEQLKTFVDLMRRELGPQ
jgi:D-threo-aldose 1-dehydrogenase